jgi:hypothetical protein
MRERDGGNRLQYMDTLGRIILNYDLKHSVKGFELDSAGLG